MMCEQTGCRLVATRIVRRDDPRDKLLRLLCKGHSKPMVDTTRPRKSRPDQRIVVERLPYRLGRLTT